MQITRQSKDVNTTSINWKGDRRCGYSKQTKMRLQIPPHLVMRLRRLLQELQLCDGAHKRRSPKSGMYLRSTSSDRATKILRARQLSARKRTETSERHRCRSTSKMERGKCVTLRRGKRIGACNLGPRGRAVGHWPKGNGERTSTLTVIEAGAVMWDLGG